MPPPPVHWPGRATIQCAEKEKSLFEDDIYEVGGGNLTFAEEYIKENPKVRYKVTEKLSSQEAEKNWPGTKDRRKRLQEKGVEVQFGVDATDLENTSSQTHRKKIIWNSPYASGVPKNKKEQEVIVDETETMLKKFLESSKYKSPEEIQIGGFKWPHIDEGWGRTTVDFEKVAEDTGWTLDSKESFHAPGKYKPVRTIGGNFKSVEMTKAKSFVFKRSEDEVVEKEKSKKLIRIPFKPPRKLEKVSNSNDRLDTETELEEVVVKQVKTEKGPVQKGFKSPRQHSNLKVEPKETSEKKRKEREAPSGFSHESKEEAWREVKTYLLSRFEKKIQEKGELARQKDETAEGYLKGHKTEIRKQFEKKWIQDTSLDPEQTAKFIWKALADSFR